MDDDTGSAGNLIIFSFFLFVGYTDFPAFHADQACMLGSHLTFTEFCNHITHRYCILGFNLDRPFFWNFIFISHHFSVFHADHTLFAGSFTLENRGITLDTSDNCFTFRFTAGFKELFNPGQTGRDITANRNTTHMEGTQGQLGTRLANGLCSHNTNCRTKFNQFSTTKVHTIACGANSVDQGASHWRANKNLFDLSLQ